MFTNRGLVNDPAMITAINDVRMAMLQRCITYIHDENLKNGSKSETKNELARVLPRVRELNLTYQELNAIACKPLDDFGHEFNVEHSIPITLYGRQWNFHFRQLGFLRSALFNKLAAVSALYDCIAGIDINKINFDIQVEKLRNLLTESRLSQFITFVADDNDANYTADNTIREIMKVSRHGMSKSSNYTDGCKLLDGLIIASNQLIKLKDLLPFHEKLEDAQNYHLVKIRKILTENVPPRQSTESVEEFEIRKVAIQNLLDRVSVPHQNVGVSVQNFRQQLADNETRRIIGTDKKWIFSMFQPEDLKKFLMKLDYQSNALRSREEYIAGMRDMPANDSSISLTNRLQS